RKSAPKPLAASSRPFPKQARIPFTFQETIFTAATLEDRAAELRGEVIHEHHQHHDHEHHGGDLLVLEEAHVPAEQEADAAGAHEAEHHGHAHVELEAEEEEADEVGRDLGPDGP